uniref:Uncharacterized protein n=1 Tax=Junco hyemalis TaxID=40217 RepID=A0A8C5JAP9_JUNHY
CRQRPSYHSHAGSAVLCFPGKSKGRDVTNSAPTALLDRHKGRHGQGQERQRTLQGHTVRRAMCKCYWNLKVAICVTQMGLCYVHLFYCDVHVAVTIERCLE